MSGSAAATSPREPLVSASWLAEHLDDPHVVVADVRWYLAPDKHGIDAYRAGHIPGAAFVDLDAELASPPNGMLPGRHPLPSLERFASFLGRIGIGPADSVVAYDDAGGAIAARLWWLLRYFGHGGGRVLDGGIQAWTASGRPLSKDAPRRPPSSPPALAPKPAMVVDKRRVTELLCAGAVVLDARARDRYEGRVEPIDARPGHVPGAKNAPFVENLASPAGPFLSTADLSAKYRELGALDAKTVVAYCGSGVTACHDLLALSLAGRPDALLYEGSWGDWARDGSLPAALGPEPGRPSSSTESR